MLVVCCLMNVVCRVWCALFIVRCAICFVCVVCIVCVLLLVVSTSFVCFCLVLAVGCFRDVVFVVVCCLLFVVRCVSVVGCWLWTELCYVCVVCRLLFVVR